MTNSLSSLSLARGIQPMWLQDGTVDAQTYERSCWLLAPIFAKVSCRRFVVANRRSVRSLELSLMPHKNRLGQDTEDSEPTKMP